MNTTTLLFFEANIEHVEQLTLLINSAYRGESSRLGWTTEADFLEGRRTDNEEIQRLLTDTDSMIMSCDCQTELIGSVHLHKIGHEVHIGMLAVSPPLQGRGIGKQLLQVAEQTAIQKWSIKRFVMSVIPHRGELIAFYERRGYQRTGISKPFPIKPSLWTPKVANLKLELLEKLI